MTTETQTYFREVHPLAMALCALLPGPIAYFGTLMVLYSRRAFFAIFGLLVVLGAFGIAIKFCVEFLR